MPKLGRAPRCEHIVFRRVGRNRDPVMGTCGSAATFEFKHADGVTNLCDRHKKVQERVQEHREEIRARRRT